MKAFIYEEAGRFYLTDKYDLRTIVFQSSEDRQKWIDGFTLETGKQLEVIRGKPDVMEELSETEASDCCQLSSLEDYLINAIEKAVVAEDEDFAQIASVWLKGIQLQREIRRQVKLLDELYER